MLPPSCDFFADAPWKLAMTLPFSIPLPSMSTDCPYLDLALFKKVSFCDFSQYSFLYVGFCTAEDMPPERRAGMLPLLSRNTYSQIHLIPFKETFVSVSM